MHLHANFLYIALTLVCLLFSGTSAVPAKAKTTKVVKTTQAATHKPTPTTTSAVASSAAAVPTDSISKYTTPWFLNNVCQRPSVNQCVFYTAYLSTTARNYATSQSPRKATIWDMWATSLYNQVTSDLQNPLRGIFASDSQRQTYFENMSRAMAQLCSGEAEVMVSAYPAVTMTGIWGRVEYDEISTGSNNQVTEIYKISNTNPTGDRSLFWSRASGLAKRFITRSKVQQDPAPELEVRTGSCGATSAASEALGQLIMF
ncbi:hypothetical protein BX600DRAFT_440819 [Xylariales sp. PMI_506]|nr:hypothetical protein BX600DRAFT_440819 [Xylariales sp. PMI_506]